MNENCFSMEEKDPWLDKVPSSVNRSGSVSLRFTPQDSSQIECYQSGCAVISPQQIISIIPPKISLAWTLHEGEFCYHKNRNMIPYGSIFTKQFSRKIIPQSLVRNDVNPELCVLTLESPILEVDFKRLPMPIQEVFPGETLFHVTFDRTSGSRKVTQYPAHVIGEDMIHTLWFREIEKAQWEALDFLPSYYPTTSIPYNEEYGAPCFTSDKGLVGFYIRSSLERDPKKDDDDNQSRLCRSSIFSLFKHRSWILSQIKTAL